jgi:hypothetical protein
MRKDLKISVADRLGVSESLQTGSTEDNTNRTVLHYDSENPTDSVKIYSSHNGFRIKSEIKLSEYNRNQDLVSGKTENQIDFSIYSSESPQNIRCSIYHKFLFFTEI